MVRTKNQIRSAKAKGAALEYDVQESLAKIYPDIYRTSERGFQIQYDLRTDENKHVFECKRLKHIDWNQAKKYFQKLITVKPTDYEPYLIFRSNRQPCLVMFCGSYGIEVCEFKDLFGIPFVKHKPIRSNKL